MPLVIVSWPLCYTRGQRQNRPGSVERLDPAFLINAKHHGLDWWIDVQANDIACLFDEQRVGRELKGFLTMRLKAKSAPDPADRRLRQLHLLWHCSCAPTRRVHRLRFQRLGDNSSDTGVIDCAWGT
jgi:hypothetical protein